MEFAQTRDCQSKASKVVNAISSEITDNYSAANEINGAFASRCTRARISNFPVRFPVFRLVLRLYFEFRSREKGNGHLVGAVAIVSERTYIFELLSAGRKLPYLSIRREERRHERKILILRGVETSRVFPT